MAIWFALRQRDSVKSLAAVVLLLGSVGLWRANLAPGWLSLPLSLAGAGILGASLLRLAAAETLASRLCRGNGDDTPQALGNALRSLGAQLEALEHRLAGIHPVTKLRTREHLLCEIDSDLCASQAPHLLGVISFANFDRLAAFDQTAANAALRRFADRMVEATNPTHVLAQTDRNAIGIWFRTGGNLDMAAAEFRSIVHVAGQEIAEGDSVLTPSLEIGSVSYPHDGSDGAQLLLRAGTTMAAPGVSSSEKLPVAAVSIQHVREQFNLEQDLAQAIGENQLRVVFQPVVDVVDSTVLGAEALLRWDHPTLGAVSPAKFIPIVESTGLAERYGLWVLDAACREARRWRDEGRRGLKVAVNVSARQLLDPQLGAKIRRTLERHGLAPGALELELTETAAMADTGRTSRLFAEFRAAGISLAIDDFGSGYSSLSYLKKLPFDKLKIDREFVTEVHHRGDSAAICKALIELGRGLRLLVLAEGVETAAEVETLRQLGCRIFQGYYFSPPVSGDQFLALARDPSWLAKLGAGRPSRSPLSARRLTA